MHCSVDPGSTERIQERVVAPVLLESFIIQVLLALPSSDGTQGRHSLTPEISLWPQDRTLQTSSYIKGNTVQTGFVNLDTHYNSVFAQ